jgi:hypothetical protein
MKRLAVVGGWVATGLVIGAIGGFAYGQRQGFDLAHGFLEREVFQGLSMRVETASRIRVGDLEGALELLDLAIDTTVLNSGLVSGGAIVPTRHIPLAQAKRYRSIVPSSGRDASEVNRLLDAVTVPEGNLLICIRPDGQPVRASGLARLMAGEKVN